MLPTRRNAAYTARKNAAYTARRSLHGAQTKRNLHDSKQGKINTTYDQTGDRPEPNPPRRGLLPVLLPIFLLLRSCFYRPLSRVAFLSLLVLLCYAVSCVTLACFVLHCLSCFEYSYLVLTYVVSLSLTQLALPCPALARPDQAEMLNRTSQTRKRRQETPKEPD